MHAMQYEITLPADYDMGIIRNRIATRSHATDDFAGLGLKVYTIREKGVDGSAVNQYAPFYLWNDVSGMNRFLWGGGGFQGIRSDFGRPIVQNWIGAGFRRGNAYEKEPGFLTKETTIIPAEADLQQIVEDALARMDARATEPGLHSSAVAIDPRTWEVIQLALWRDTPPTADHTAYRVLHLSHPEADELPEGRHWPL